MGYTVMAKPNRLKEIEAEYGEPLATLIPRLLNEYGSMPKVARVVDIGFDNLFRWCQDNGIEKQITWVKREMEPVHAD